MRLSPIEAPERRPSASDAAAIREHLMLLGHRLLLALPPKIQRWSAGSQWIAESTIRDWRRAVKAIHELVTELDALFPVVASTLPTDREEAVSREFGKPHHVYDFDLADHLRLANAINRYHSDYMILVKLEPKSPSRTALRKKAWALGRCLSHTVNLQDTLEFKFKLYGDDNPYRHGHWYLR